MSVASETKDQESTSGLDVPVPPVSDIGEHRPMRLTVPLLLAAGWGALLTFSLMFLMEDGRTHVAASERPTVADQSDADRVPVTRPRWPETAQTGPDQTVPAQVVPPQVVPAHVAPAHVAPAQEAAVATAGVIKVASVAPEPLPSVTPVQKPSPPAERVNYVGTWGPTAQACGATSRRRGYLPAMITEDGAKAGRTLCRFRNGRRDGIAWTVAADCTERGRNWTSQVRLLVDGDRLIWSSGKGQSSYVRCGRRDG